MSDRTALLRYVRIGVLPLALALAVTGCFGGKSGAQRAQDSLTKGLQAHQAGRIDEAMKDYRDVLKADPENKWAHYNIGQIEQSQGQAAAAESEYRKVLSIDPNFEFALFNLAIIRANAGAKQEAVELYRRAITVNPNNASAHLNLGFALIDLGQKTAGDRELRAAVNIDPTLSSRVPSSIFR
jgi:tetratricopeptide (TPR) repeat protein